MDKIPTINCTFLIFINTTSIKILILPERLNQSILINFTVFPSGKRIIILSIG